LRAVLADSDARLVVGLMSARMLMIGAADVLFVLMALDLLGMGQPGAGILSAALGAGAIVGGATSFLLAGRTRLASVAALGACLWGLTLGVSGWLASPVLATALIVAGGAGLAIVDVAGRTILQRSVRDEVLTRVFGIQEGLAMAALAAGSILVPGLIAVLGLTGAILVIAGLLPLIVLFAWSRLVALDARTPVPAQAIALLRRVSLFGPLAAPSLEAIARRATWVRVPPGSIVIREGDSGDRYFVLASGAVRVERQGRQLRELTTPGEGFGEIALLRDVPRTATVIATVESVFMTIDRDSFLAAVTGNPQVTARAETAVASAAM
jgi:MFS family permease